MLNRCRIQIVANSGQNTLACRTVITHDAYLDEPVRFQTAVNFQGNRRSQAFAADDYGRFKDMSARLERTTLGRRELQRHGNLPNQAF